MGRRELGAATNMRGRAGDAGAARLFGSFRRWRGGFSLCAGAGLGAALLAWCNSPRDAGFVARKLIRWRHRVRRFGLWAERRTLRHAAAEFQRNEAAIRSLGLSPRECEILAQLAAGQSNKEMARALGISPNTVKTHVARVYEKLEVQRRIQAVEKARWLALIP